jgi:hypothetical protein
MLIKTKKYSTILQKIFVKSSKKYENIFTKINIKISQKFYMTKQKPIGVPVCLFIPILISLISPQVLKR